MPNDLPLPEELMHLLEKRTGQDRRESEQQGSKEKPPAASQKASPKRDRRKTGRRKEDKPGSKNA